MGKIETVLVYLCALLFVFTIGDVAFHTIVSGLPATPREAGRMILVDIIDIVSSIAVADIVIAFVAVYALSKIETVAGKLEDLSEKIDNLSAKMDKLVEREEFEELSAKVDNLADEIESVREQIPGQ